LQGKPAGGQTLGAVGPGGRGDERHPPEGQLEPRAHQKPVLPSRPPIDGQPRPSTPSDDGPYDPGVFYVYDNSEPESSYMAGEPCRIVCQSDPSVRCSSYSGDCQGLPDRLICDGQTFMCPASNPVGPIGAIGASEQSAVQAQAAHLAHLDQADQPCEGGSQDRSQDRGHGRHRRGRHEGRHQTCDQNCRQGQTNAEVSCSGTNAVP
jgi:hypothetical protein